MERFAYDNASGKWSSGANGALWVLQRPLELVPGTGSAPSPRKMASLRPDLAQVERRKHLGGGHHGHLERVLGYLDGMKSLVWRQNRLSPRLSSSKSPPAWPTCRRKRRTRQRLRRRDRRRGRSHRQKRPPNATLHAWILSLNTRTHALIYGVRSLFAGP